MGWTKANSVHVLFHHNFPITFIISHCIKNNCLTCFQTYNISYLINNPMKEPIASWPTISFDPFKWQLRISCWKYSTLDGETL